MAKIFELSEIIKFAIDKEIESFQLYKKLAAQAKNPIIQKLFAELMQQEHLHEEFFSEMLSNFKTTPETQSYDEEYHLYIKEMIDSGRKASRPENLDYNNLDAALKFAVGRERDSILFYSAFENLLKQDTQKRYIENIIHQEGEHIKKIFKIKELIQSVEIP